MPSYVLPNLGKPSVAGGFATSAADAAHPELWNGLVGAWSPEAGSGSVLLPNRAGNYAHAKLHGSQITQAPGIYGPSMGGWGSSPSQQATISDCGGVAGAGIGANGASPILDAYRQAFGGGNRRGGSLVAWFKTTSIASFRALLAMSGGNTSLTIYWFLRLGNGGSVRHQGQGSNGSGFNLNYTPSTAYSDDRWHMVTGVCQPDGGVELWYDGVRVLTSTSTTPQPAGDLSDFQADIGIWNDSGGTQTNAYSAGEIGTTMVYNRPLSPGEITKLYQHPLTYLEQSQYTFVPAATTPATTTTYAAIPQPQASPQHYARSASESAHPELWDGLTVAIAPAVSPRGNVATNVADGRLYQQAAGKGLAYDIHRGIPSLVGDGGDSQTLEFTGPAVAGEAGSELSVFWSGEVLDSSQNAVFEINSSSQSTVNKGVALLQNGTAVALQTRSSANGGGISINYADIRTLGGWVSDVSDTQNLWMNGRFYGATAATSPFAFGPFDRVTVGKQQPLGWIAQAGTNAAFVWNRKLSESEFEILDRDPLAPFRLAPQPVIIPGTATPAASVTVDLATAAATATGATVAPAVALGGITSTPAAATGTAAVVSPAVALGSVTTTPTAATATGAVVAPSVAGSGVDVTPTAATATGAVVAPVVSVGALDVTPAAATAAAATITPAVVSGSVVVAPAAATAAGDRVLPNVVGGLLVVPPVMPAPAPYVPEPDLRPLVKRAFRDFLLSDKKTDSAIRNVARDTLRRHVGENVYNFERLPRQACDMAITLSNAGGQPVTALAETLGCRTPIIDVQVLGSDRLRPGASDEAVEALIALCHQYRGMLSEQLFAEVVTLETEPFDNVAAPQDGSDRWTTAQTLSFLVGCRAATATEKAAYNRPNTQAAESVGWLPSSAAWLLQNGAATIADQRGITGLAIELQPGESARLTTNVQAGTYYLYSRHRFTGASVGNASLRLSQATQQTLTIDAVTPADEYEGGFTQNTVAGYYRLGPVSLVGGSLQITVDGPSSLGDALILNHLILFEGG